MAKAEFRPKDLSTPYVVEWDSPDDHVVGLFKAAIEAHRESEKHGSNEYSRSLLNALRRMLDEEEAKYK